MFVTKRLTKIRIFGPKSQLSAVIEVLHSLKLIHLIDHKKTESLDIGTPIASSEQLSALLVKVRSLLSSFQLKPQAFIKKNYNLSDIEKEVAFLAEEYNSFQAKNTKIKTVISQKTEILSQLRILAAIGINADALQPYKSLACFIGFVKTQKKLSKELHKLTPNMCLSSTLYNGKPIIALFIAKDYAEKANILLQKHGFQAILFPELISYKGDIKEHIKKLELSVALLQKDCQHLDTEIQKFELRHMAFLQGVESYLKQEVEKAQAPLRFAETPYAFVSSGWVSREEYLNLKTALEKHTDNKVHIEISEIKKTDNIPISLQNIFFIKPFEFFLSLYTLPKYNELDPSFFLFFSFPLFFGMMLGDVGYGIITLIIFAFLLWKLPKAQHLLTAMILCSLVSIFFGAIFGEYLGFEYVSEDTGRYLAENLGLPLHQELLHSGEIVYSFPRLLNRLHGELTLLGSTLPTVLILGALLGFLHVNLGLFLGFINEVISHGFLHAFFTKISWYILEFGVAFLVLARIGLIPFPWWVGISFVFLAGLFLFLGEGIRGILEIFTLFTNILSYLRLGAVGLASVGFAVVVNESLAMPILEKGGIYFVVGGLIFVAGHVINIGLGILGPFLHSLRLHYVEFFSKFYKGGGVPFIAFGEEKNNWR